MTFHNQLPQLEGWALLPCGVDEKGKAPIDPTTAQALSDLQSMNEPLIIWSETLRFLELLARTPETVDALVFPPRRGPGSDKATAFKIKLDEAGRQEAERLLSMPLYKFHSLGVRPNVGGVLAKEITECRALFFETDGGLSIEAQEALPDLLGLPEPTVTVWTGGKSLHQYWAGPEGDGLSPAEWMTAQRRLIAAVASVSEEAGVDERLTDPGRVMRAPGGLHPATGERCRIRSDSGKLYSLADLVVMLPEPKKAPSVARAEGSKEEELAKARNALAFLPPLEFTSYGKWLGVGMALHSVSTDLLTDWIEWSRGMEEAFNEPEHSEKWETFDEERDESITLGSLVHWAKQYGYQAPPPRKADPSSPPPLSWSELIALALEAVKVGDVDAEMQLRAEIAGRFRRNDAQVDAALFRLLTVQEAGPMHPESSDSVDLRTVQGLDYLVDGFLPANGLTLAYGSKGAGKTTAAVALGFSVLEGRGFLDHSKPTPAGKVLFVASDSGAGPLRTVIQEMGYGDHEALIPGDGQRFFVWAHEADQGHSAWDVGVRGCVKLLQFVKEKGVSLVVIDSAKAVCAKAGLAYTDNDAVNALLTFMKEVVTPHASVLFLSHDGTAVGSHAGAKAWAEIVDVVHRQTRPDGDHRSRTWTVVKNRLGPTREFSYSLDEGELVLAQGVESIGDASSAVLRVLREAHERNKDKLSRKGIHEEVFKRFDFAPKTIDNTLQRLVQGKAPKVVRKGKGFYALSSKELYRGCLVDGEEWTHSPSAGTDLPITRALPEGNDERSSDCPPVPETVPVGNGRVMASPLATTDEISDSSPRRIRPLNDLAPVDWPEKAETSSIQDLVLSIPSSTYPFCIQQGDEVELLTESLGSRSGWQVVAASGVVARIENARTREIREVAQSDLLYCCPF